MTTGGSKKIPGVPSPRKIDGFDYSGPLAPVYYKKERERRRQEKGRQVRSEILNSSSKGSAKLTNGHVGHGVDSDVERLNSTANDGDVANRIQSARVSYDSADSPVAAEKVGRQFSEVNTSGVVSDTDYETDTYADGDVQRSLLEKEMEAKGYVTEDDIDKMQSGLGKEILREIKMQMDSSTAAGEDTEVQFVPDDPIKASRSPDAKTEVQLPYFCEIKFGPIATGINRYCDSWLLEQAMREPMSLGDYNNFMQGFHRFTNASNEPWKNSTTNSLVDGAMSDTEGMRRYTTSSASGARMYSSGYKSDGYKSDMGGYSSSPEMARRKMTRYNSLDVRKAWYHERFLTYVQMYHKKGNLLFEQQKEACMQHIRKSIGSLSRSADLKVYPKEKLFTNLNKKLPEDVNRSRLEMHLSDEEFVDMFAMTQDQFKALPGWKQNVLKQLNYLF